MHSTKIIDQKLTFAFGSLTFYYFLNALDIAPFAFSNSRASMPYTK